LIAYYHFVRITHYGLIANFIAVPVTALWIMPMDVLGTILIPFDLEYWPFHGGWCLYCNNGGR
jgi:competence protein ComEC